jgi:hypothetical protein
MKTNEILITPNVANEFLLINKNNRPVNNNYVNKLSAIMKSGMWNENTGESIKVCINGDLIDGQHRLLAIIKSGVSLKFMVVYELPVSAFEVIDQGKKRSVNDVLFCMGIGNGKRLSEVVRNVDKLINGKILNNDSGGTGLTPKNILMILNSDFDSYNESMNYGRSQYEQGNIGSMSFYGALHYILKDKHKLLCEKFIENVATGINIKSAKCPSYVLRQRLIMEKAQNVSKMSRGIMGVLYIKAWNAFILGKQINCLKFAKNEEELPKLIN